MIRFLFSPLRWLIKLLMICLLIGVVGVWLVLLFADHLVERELRKNTGFPVDIGTLDVRVFSTRVDMLDMEIRNPTSYAEEEFLNVDRFSAKLRPFSLLREKREWDEVILYIRQLSLVQNVKGEINADQFLKKLGMSHSPFLPSTNTALSDKIKPFMIHNLKLRIGSLQIVNEGVHEQTSRTLILNYRAEFDDVNDLRVLLNEMQSRMEPVAAELIVYLLAEALSQIGNLSGKDAILADELTAQGSYLWEMGEGVTFKLKNFIEGLKE
jgi:uncharacterized protein involved in outer membrane biogenesis